MLGLGLSIPQLATRGGRTLTLSQQVAALFANGEQGVWYDPSDFSTMFQDAAGTTPVTAMEQPVGLMLDKSKGLVLGSELVTNGAFDTNTAWVSANTGTGTATITGGKLVLTGTDASNRGRAYQILTCVVGRSYQLFSSTSGAASNIGVGIGIGQTGLAAISGGQQCVFTATATSVYVTLYTSSAGGTAYLDNISVRELPGNAGRQATTTARPLIKAAPTRIYYDGVDDNLVTTFPSSLGANCTVARSVPGVGANILTGQTIGTTYTDNTNHCGLIIINRALTASETSSVTAYLNQKAGV